MTSDEKGTDWTSVNHAVQKIKRESQPLATTGGMNPRVAIPPTIQGAEGAPEAVANPRGILAKIKTGALSRQAGLAQSKAWYEGQLEVMQHRMTEAVRVRKAETTTIAEQMLASINAQHLTFLTELGLKNEGDRSAALAKLTDQTSASLSEAQQKDWPDALREQFMDGVLKRHRAFFDKLVQELGG